MATFTGLGSQLTNTPIVAKLYNSRGLITHGTGNQNCMRRDNGDLWAHILETAGYLHTFVSYDNGFSWFQHGSDPTTTAATNKVNTYETNGPHVNVVVNTKWDVVQFFHPDEFTTVVQGVSISLVPFAEGLDSPTYTPANFTVLGAAVAEEQFFRVCNNENTNWLFFRDTTNRLSFRKISPRDNALATTTAITGTNPIFNTLGLLATKDSHVHVLYSNTVSSKNRIQHIQYQDEPGTVTAQHEVMDMNGLTTSGVDLNIAIDGYDNLCCVWSTVSGYVSEAYYATSLDDGATWSSALITKTAGHGSYVDSVVNKATARTNVMGGSNGGFILSYVRDDASAVPKTFVRLLTTTDGSTYTLGAEKQIAQHLAATQAVVGLHFFEPMSAALQDLSDPGLVRVAYQIGEGDSDTQEDGTKVAIGQELLLTSAYPSPLTTDVDTYSTDPATANTIRVLANIVGNPGLNLDWYTLGKTGDFTDRYLAAFERVGSTLRILKYEPVDTSWLDDRTTYGAPTEYQVTCIFEPRTYVFPIRDLNVDDQTNYVEQDIRRCYLPPDFFLSRVFAINQGGFLKRTVWLAQFGGNEYELSQVVPHFISNQICYYSANAYVVGPSRDPFARAILPSET
jgi:hypothetical protein